MTPRRPFPGRDSVKARGETLSTTTVVLAVALMTVLASCGPGLPAAHNSAPRRQSPALRSVARSNATHSGGKQSRTASKKTPPGRAGGTKAARSMASTTEHAGPKGPTGTVIRDVDGDTIHVFLHGADTDVRLIGIDTPEDVRPGTPVQCYSRAAASFTTSHLVDRSVRLEFDVERTDVYGRTLAYVHLNGQMFNLALVRQGYARAYPYPPNTRYESRFAAAESYAQRHHLGLWGTCPYFGAPAHAARSGSSRSSTSSGCTPGYSPCLPSASDYDCAGGGGDGPRFARGPVRITGSDPYGLDGNHDGVGCGS